MVASQFPVINTKGSVKNIGTDNVNSIIIEEKLTVSWFLMQRNKHGNKQNSHIEDKHNFLKFQNVKASKIYTNWHK